MIPPNARLSRRHPPIHEEGFTLIELLSVVAVIGLLAVLILPNVTKMQERGLEASCLNKIRQIATGLNASTSDNNGSYPKFVRDPLFSPNIPQPDTYLEPYIGTKDPAIWHCPSDSGKGAQNVPGFTTRSYSFNSYLTGDFTSPPITNKNSIPKQSTTVLVCENWVGWPPFTSNGVVTLYPYDQTGNGAPSYALKLHRDQELSNYAFVDGHVEFLKWHQVSPNGIAGRGMFATDPTQRDGL